MDWLKSEIDSKKRQLDSIQPATGSNNGDGSSDPSAKYLKRTDLEKARQQEREQQLRKQNIKYKQQQQQQQQQRQSAAATGSDGGGQKSVSTLLPKSGSKSPRRSATPEISTLSKGDPATTSTGNAQPASEGFMVSNEDAIRRLRHKGQPIRLFGESDKDRRLRLRALELIEERSEGQRNDFMKALEQAEKGAAQSSATDLVASTNQAVNSADKHKSKGKSKLEGENANASDSAVSRATKSQSKEPNPKDEEVIVDVSLVKTNPHKVYPQIYHALKRVLKEWEQSLIDRPESVRRSTQGKIAAATQQTSAEYLKPLFKSLRKRELAPDVLRAIAEITFYMQTREYLKANDSYLRLSIGNAPWPIGVTMVGIHERAGRSRIASDNVAHVLNDEESRKYIQSLKRLLTFAQTVRPPADLSQLMG